MSSEHQQLKLEGNHNGISTESLMELLNKMVVRGYFYPTKTAKQVTHCDDEYDVLQATTTQYIYSSSRKEEDSSASENSRIVMPHFPSECGGKEDDLLFVMTKEHLAYEIQKCIEESGRISFTELCEKFNFSLQDIQMTTRIVVTMKNKYPIHIVGNDVLNEKYLDDYFRDQVPSVTEEKKPMADIAQDMSLPLQFVTSALTKRIQNGLLVGIKVMTLRDGTKQIVTQQYEEKMFHLLEDLLQNAQEPISMANIVNDIPLEPSAMLNYIRSQCGNHHLGGYLQEDSSSCVLVANPLSAVYVPRSYKKRQEEEVVSFFRATGCITFDKCEQIGLSKKNLIDIISVDNPQVVTLNKCIVYRSMIEPPIRSALEECMALDTFLDLSPYFPEKMSVSDCVTFLKDYVFCEMDDSVLLGCLIFLVDKEPFYFSHGMIKNVSTKLLQSLIVDFAKQKAKQIVEGSSESVSADHDHDIAHKSNNRKFGRGSSKKKRMKKDALCDKAVSYGIVPLVTIAKAVAKEYPDLAEIQSGYEVPLDDGHIPQWNDELDGSDGPLYSFCRHVFGTSVKFQEDCTKAVEAEIARVKAIKIGASIQSCSTTNAAYIEASFENAFKSACHFLQIMAKYPKSLLNPDQEQKNTGKEEIMDWFLNTCAADFTRRLTEYALFKYGVQPTLFSFYHDQEIPLESDYFYSEIDTFTKRNFSRIFLSCRTDKDSTKCNPLQKLRDVLPADKGANLAQMWILCGGQAYSGGEIPMADGSRTFSPGNLEKFLSHIQETCLSICGIPYKILDKKIEKQILTSRRKELTSQLEHATSPNDIVELSFIILFQKLKGIAICNITEFAIDDLCCEKKIPIAVVEVLQKVTQSFMQGNEIDATTLKSIKELGLCKDLSGYCAQSVR